MSVVTFFFNMIALLCFILCKDSTDWFPKVEIGISGTDELLSDNISQLSIYT